jgi:hypothetical protein
MSVHEMGSEKCSECDAILRESRGPASALNEAEVGRVLSLVQSGLYKK